MTVTALKNADGKNSNKFSSSKVSFLYMQKYDIKSCMVPFVRT